MTKNIKRSQTESGNLTFGKSIASPPIVTTKNPLVVRAVVGGVFVVSAICLIAGIFTQFSVIKSITSASDGEISEFLPAGISDYLSPILMALGAFLFIFAVYYISRGAFQKTKEMKNAEGADHQLRREDVHLPSVFQGSSNTASSRISGQNPNRQSSPTLGQNLNRPSFQTPGQSAVNLSGQSSPTSGQNPNGQPSQTMGQSTAPNTASSQTLGQNGKRGGYATLKKIQQDYEGMEPLEATGMGGEFSNFASTWISRSSLEDWGVNISESKITFKDFLAKVVVGDIHRECLLKRLPSLKDPLRGQVLEGGKNKKEKLFKVGVRLFFRGPDKVEILNFFQGLVSVAFGSFTYIDDSSAYHDSKGFVKSNDGLGLYFDKSLGVKCQNYKGVFENLLNTCQSFLLIAEALKERKEKMELDGESTTIIENGTLHFIEATLWSFAQTIENSFLNVDSYKFDSGLRAEGEELCKKIRHLTLGQKLEDEEQEKARLEAQSEKIQKMTFYCDFLYEQIRCIKESKSLKPSIFDESDDKDLQKVEEVITSIENHRELEVAFNCTRDAETVNELFFEMDKAVIPINGKCVNYHTAIRSFLNRDGSLPPMSKNMSSLFLPNFTKSINSNSIQVMRKSFLMDQTDRRGLDESLRFLTRALILFLAFATDEVFFVPNVSFIKESSGEWDITPGCFTEEFTKDDFLLNLFKVGTFFFCTVEALLGHSGWKEEQEEGILNFSLGATNFVKSCFKAIILKFKSGNKEDPSVQHYFNNGVISVLQQFIKRAEHLNASYKISEKYSVTCLTCCNRFLYDRIKDIREEGLLGLLNEDTTGAFKKARSFLEDRKMRFGRKASDKDFNVREISSCFDNLFSKTKKESDNLVGDFTKVFHSKLSINHKVGMLFFPFLIEDNMFSSGDRNVGTCVSETLRYISKAKDYGIKKLFTAMMSGAIPQRDIQIEGDDSYGLMGVVKVVFFAWIVAQASFTYIGNKDSENKNMVKEYLLFPAMAVIKFLSTRMGGIAGGGEDCKDKSISIVASHILRKIASLSEQVNGLDGAEYKINAYHQNLLNESMQFLQNGEGALPIFSADILNYATSVVDGVNKELSDKKGAQSTSKSTSKEKEKEIRTASNIQPANRSEHGSHSDTRNGKDALEECYKFLSEDNLQDFGNKREVDWKWVRKVFGSRGGKESNPLCASTDIEKFKVFETKFFQSPAGQGDYVKDVLSKVGSALNIHSIIWGDGGKSLSLTDDKKKNVLGNISNNLTVVLFNYYGCKKSEHGYSIGRYISGKIKDEIDDKSGKPQLNLRALSNVSNFFASVVEAVAMRVEEVGFKGLDKDTRNIFYLGEVFFDTFVSRFGKGVGFESEFQKPMFLRIKQSLSIINNCAQSSGLDVKRERDEFIDSSVSKFSRPNKRRAPRVYLDVSENGEQNRSGSPQR